MDLRTGAAFWPLRDGLLAVYPPLERDERCDVAVIGAGITGALAAHRLTEAGLRCRAARSSRRGDGQHRRLDRAAALRDRHLARRAGRADGHRARGAKLAPRPESHRRSRDICADAVYGFARRPSVYLASTRWDVTSLKAEHALRAEHGFDVAWLDRSRNRGAGSASSAHGAIQSRGDAEVDPYRLTHGLIAEAARRGARVYDRTDVTKVRVDRQAASR